MTPIQTKILEYLRIAVAGKPTREVVYSSEWLGYLPYGAYHWFEVQGKEIATFNQLAWSYDDLVALEQEGHLSRREALLNPDDEWFRRITFVVS